MEITKSKKAEPTTAAKLPRGIRNNNPLNIEKGMPWRGLRDFATDERFCEFQTMALGFRAAFRIMQTYYTRYGCRTLNKIVKRWAPPSENNTQAYIDYVCKMTGIQPFTTLPNPRLFPTPWDKILLAMASYENGTDMRKYETDCKKGIEISRI